MEYHYLRYYNDDRHGWLVVPHSLLAKLAVHISSYSHMDEQYAYLEDGDERNFIDAIREQFPDAVLKTGCGYHPGRSWIRDLPAYQPGASAPR